MAKFEWQEGGQTFSEPMACENCERLTSEVRALRECYECCKHLIDAADDEDLLIGVGMGPDDVMGPNEKRMRKAVDSVSEGLNQGE